MNFIEIEKNICHFKNLAKNKKWAKIINFLKHKHASEASEYFQYLDLENKITVFRDLPYHFSTKVFSYFSPKQKLFFIKNLNNKELKKLLADLNPDDRTDLFESVPSKTGKKLMRLLTSEDLKETTQLLDYPEDSVGRLMTPDFLTIKPNWTIKQALKYIRKNGKNVETIDVIYVVDDNERLIDDLKIKNLLIADPQTKIKNITSHYLTKLSVFDDQEIALELIKKYNLVALPVVNEHDILVGIVTIDDLMDISDEESTEDIHKIGGLSVEEGPKGIVNVFETPLKILYRSRISWLMILVGVNIFSGAAMAFFEETIAQAVALVFFLPLLIDSGGNAGSQASTLMIRALSLGDVKVHHWAKMIGREVAVATGLGITMALGVMLIGIFRSGIDIAIVAALSMIIIVLVGSTIGMSLPFLFTKFNKDPAAASGPLVTSIADICGVLIYFYIASVYLTVT